MRLASGPRARMTSIGGRHHAPASRVSCALASSYARLRSPALQRRALTPSARR
jgi:hypothetical protein